MDWFLLGMFVLAAPSVFYGLRYFKASRLQKKLETLPKQFKLGQEVPPPPACVRMREKCRAEGREPVC